MNTLRTRLAVVLLTCLPLLAACNRQPDPPPAADNPGQPTSALGGIVKKATDEARKKLATENISISDGMHFSVNGHSVRRAGIEPSAEITPQGDLLIDGKAVMATPAQRALLLQYRQHLVAIAVAGMDIGVQGADLGMKAAGEAIRGIFSGNTDQVEQHVEAEAAKIETAARKLCLQLPALLATQQKLAAALPEFKPYARMEQGDVDDCYDDSVRDVTREQVRSEIRHGIRDSIRRTAQSATRGSELAEKESAQDAAAEAEAASVEESVKN